MPGWDNLFNNWNREEIRILRPCIREIKKVEKISAVVCSMNDTLTQINIRIQIQGKILKQ